MEERLIFTFSQGAIVITTLAAMLFGGHFASGLFRREFPRGNADEEVEQEYVRFAERCSLTFSAILAGFTSVIGIAIRLLFYKNTIPLNVAILYGITFLGFLFIGLFVVYVLPFLPNDKFAKYKKIAWIILVIENVWPVGLFWLT